MRAGATFVGGVGITVASTFAQSLGLSVHQQRWGFAVGAALIVVSLLLLTYEHFHKKPPTDPPPPSVAANVEDVGHGDLRGNVFQHSTVHMDAPAPAASSTPDRVALLRSHYARGRDLREQLRLREIPYDTPSADPREFENRAGDLTCQWAHEVWKFMREDDNFPQSAPCFAGAQDDPLDINFPVDCRLKIAERGSADAYLLSRLQFIEQVLERFDRP